MKQSNNILRSSQAQKEGIISILSLKNIAQVIAQSIGTIDCVCFLNVTQVTAILCTLYYYLFHQVMATSQRHVYAKS